MDFRLLAVLLAVGIPLDWAAGSSAAFYSFNYDSGFILRIGLGTPAQGPFGFDWTPLIARDLRSFGMPTVTDKNLGYGQFNASASKSFKFLRKAGDHMDSFIGTDFYQLPGGPKLQMEVGVRRDEEYNRNILDFHRGGNGIESFADQLLKHLNGSAITFRVNSSREMVNNGFVIFGPANPIGCSPQWDVLPAAPLQSAQFTFHLHEVQIGDFHSTEPVALAFAHYYYFFPPALFAATMKSLGVAESHQIDCSQKTPIVLRAGRQQWTLGAEHYQRRWPTGECEFLIRESTEDWIWLPLFVLNGNCLRFDFAEDTVAFSKVI